MKNVKNIPKFDNEQAENKFWQNADSTEYINWKNSSVAIFTNLKPSVKSISIRLPQMMINELKQLANKRDIPYQSLIKVFLQERIDREYKK
ncbi:MAG: BrnA antitoxin family protein [Bacteroidetes bacterium]|nr:BrnA antitoxin family protein [Bacteroidota bacterium]